MEPSSSPRTIGLIGAISIGIGGMVGGGIFAVLGEAISFAGGATPIAFGFAGIIALLTAYSYAKLSAHFQNRGGTVFFVDQAFQHNLLSGGLNLFLWLSYLVTIALYAKAFASYGATFFTSSSNYLLHVLISVSIVLPMLINLISSSFVSKSETIIVAVKLLLLLLIMILGAATVDSERLSPHNWKPGLEIFIAGMIIFVAFEGFELIANSAEEIKNPEKNLPLAFYLSVVGVLILYIGIAVIVVGSVPEKQLIAAQDYALALAAEPALGKEGFHLVAIAAVLATFSAINATLYGNARLGYLIAKEGELPEALDHEKRHIPMNGILTIAIISLLLANSIDLTEIAILGSAGFLLIFAVVNFSAYRLREQIGASALIPLIATLASLLALITLLIQTAQSNPTALVIFCGFVLASFGFEWLYGRSVRGHWFHRSY
ncbi:APC family permease [Thiomicrorhabdus heinhorstiae]|uniref:Amino acid permease n=1 Tax=Thiomicrorhabdus heinhorstiae TaxID=2748010 RepID=A0ABS0BUV2_9GAMM|nr:APC family permease [Thiomicrorhabdus heinhorstiae]MBF6057613.1 amino acid permease [Thiomicrorhabdus heinhorstiae]